MGYGRGVSLLRDLTFRRSAFVLLIVVPGCGARTELDDRPIPRSDPSPKPTPMATPKPTPAKPSGGGMGGGNSDSPIGTSNELGECKLGSTRQAGQDCPYVAENRCYSDPHSACACVCPRNAGDTTCAEGFFADAAGAIEVNCFAL